MSIKYSIFYLVNVMLLLLLIHFSYSINCPEGTPYLYNEDLSIIIKKDEWYYFRTNIRYENQKSLLVIAIKSNQPVILYSSDAYECPDESFPSFLNVSASSRYIRGNDYYHSPNGIVSIGIKALNDSRVYLKLEGHNQIKKSTKFIIKLSLTFLIMITITGFYFFYVVLPNEMKEKDKEENIFF